MIFLINYIEHLIVSFGGLGVFLASIIEEIIVPIPSVLVQSGAGLFLLNGQSLSFSNFFKLIFSVALPSALGVAIGSLVIYLIAFYGGDYAIKKYGKYFFINYQKLEKARISVSKKDKVLVLLTVLRFVPLFPNSLVTAACGLIKIPLKKYLITTFIGIFIRALYLGAIGWLAGVTSDSFFGIENILSKIGILMLFLVSLSFLTAFLISIFYKKSKTI